MSEQNKTRKIFIDCGANNGCSVRYFRKNFDEQEEFEYYCFEPNLNFVEDLKKIKNINLSTKAIWIKDGLANFYHVKVNRYGDPSGKTGADTLNEIKSNWNKKVHQSIEEKEVRTIDLSRWVKENFKKEDFIVLKLDIEGSEYEVLPHLIKTNTMQYLDKIFCELHGPKCGKTKKQTDELIAECKASGHDLYEWDALGH